MSEQETDSGSRRAGLVVGFAALAGALAAAAILTVLLSHPMRQAALAPVEEGPTGPGEVLIEHLLLHDKTVGEILDQIVPADSRSAMAWAAADPQLERRLPFFAHGATLGEVLELLFANVRAETGRDLFAPPSKEEVQPPSKEAAEKEVVPRVIDLLDLTARPRDFPAVVFRMSQVPPEAEGFADLPEMIRKEVAPDSWDDQAGRTVSVIGGYLLVTHSESVGGQVETYLARFPTYKRMRRFRRVMQQPVLVLARRAPFRTLWDFTRRTGAELNFAAAPEVTPAMLDRPVSLASAGRELWAVLRQACDQAGLQVVVEGSVLVRLVPRAGSPRKEESDEAEHRDSVGDDARRRGRAHRGRGEGTASRRTSVD